MNIIQIQIRRGSRTEAFGSYVTMIQTKLIKWRDLNEEKYQQLKIHLGIIHQLEKKLEQVYAFPSGSLKGAHLIFGSNRSMREGMLNEGLRNQIRNKSIKFYVKIIAETRRVTVYKEENDDGIMEHFIKYQLLHNFYGIAIIEDQIAIP